ncbi:MAG TPA: oligosaccharide flippase family protein [Solirubrobacteraceae bacterium]|nr:oligosaccharide flippase family protein [Solirubrobacteraceae bacterium]
MDPGPVTEESSSWGRRTRGGLMWSIAAFAGGRFFTFVAVAILARVLVPAEFGVVAATLVYLAVLELASDLGMKATVVYEQERGFSERLHTAFTVNLIIAVLLTVVGVLLAPAVAGFFRIEGYDGLFRLAALTLLFTALGNIHDSILLRDLDFRKRTVPLLARAIVRGAVSIALALAGLGADSLVLGMLAGAFVFTVMQWRLTRFRPRLRIDRTILRSMAAYGSAQALLGVVALVATRVDTAVVGRVLGERSLGLYSIAFRVPELVLESIAWQVSLVSFPALSNKRAEDRAGLNRAALKIVRYQALYSFPVAVGVAVLAVPLTVTVFSDTWREAGALLVPVSLMLGAYTVAIPMGEVFRAIGRQRWLIALALLQLPALIVGVILAAQEGVVAVAWARAGAVVLHAVLTFALVMRVQRMGVRAVLAALAPGLVAALGVAAAAGAVRLSWPDASLGPLLAGTAAGAAGGALAVRVLAPGAWRQVLHQFADIREMRRAASAA